MSQHTPFTIDELKRAPRALFSEARIIRFQDVDAAGIIFNPRVIEYFSDAYFSMVRAGGFDVPTLLRTGEVGFPVVHAEADYLAPLRFGDAIRVEIVAASVGETSYRLGFRVKGPDDRAAAVGQTVQVCIDRRTFKPHPIPDDLRAILAPEGASVARSG